MYLPSHARAGSMTSVCPFEPSETAPSDSHTVRWHRVFFLFTAVGVASGLALMIWTWVRAASMSADGAHYMELAERSWRLGPNAGMDWYSGPGYPVLVGWVYGVIGDLDFAGRATSLVFGVMTLVGVARLSCRMFSAPIACVAVALLAVHTTFVRHTVMAETDAMYGCWLVWSILAMWELKHARSLVCQGLWTVVAGLTLGAGFLTRPEAVPLAGLLVLWFLFARVGDDSATSLPRRAALSFVIAAILLAVALPYLLTLRRELGRWSLSGKERSIVLKFVPDKRNYEEVLKLGVTGALLDKPWNILHWLPYHAHWGVPQFVKALHPVVLVLAGIGLSRRRVVSRAAGAVGLLVWVSVPFIVFFLLTFPGRRYFMQAMPPWTILAAVGAIELSGAVAEWRRRLAVRFSRASGEEAARRAFHIALATPMVLIAASTLWGNRRPIEESLRTERAVGERIHAVAGPGRRVLTFGVAAFYSRGERVPLWGPMQGIVRCHGYGKPLSYDELVSYVQRHGVEYLVIDHDLRADCPEFLARVRTEDFELIADDIVDHHGPHLVYRYTGRHSALRLPVAN